MICSNMILFSQICFSAFINNLNNYAHFGLLLYLIPIILLCFLFKGFNKGFNPIKYINNNKIIKTLILFYLLLFITIFIYLTSTVIKFQFYSELSIYLIFIGLLITCVYISICNINQIINISSIFFIIVLIFNIIPFFHLEERNLSLLLPVGINKNIIKCFIIFLFPLDNITLAINSASFEKGFSRKTFIIGNILSFILLLIIFLDNMTLLSSKYYIDTIFSPFIRWSVYQGNKFFESYEIILLVIMIITTIFKVSYNLCTIRILLKQNNTIKKSFSQIIIVFLLLCILYYFINSFNTILTISLIVLLILISLIYLYFIYLSYKQKCKEVIS